MITRSVPPPAALPVRAASWLLLAALAVAGCDEGGPPAWSQRCTASAPTDLPHAGKGLSHLAAAGDDLVYLSGGEGDATIVRRAPRAGGEGVELARLDEDQRPSSNLLAAGRSVFVVLRDWDAGGQALAEIRLDRGEVVHVAVVAPDRLSEGDSSGHQFRVLAADDEFVYVGYMAGASIKGVGRILRVSRSTGGVEILAELDDVPERAELVGGDLWYTTSYANELYRLPKSGTPAPRRIATDCHSFAVVPGRAVFCGGHGRLRRLGPDGESARVLADVETADGVRPLFTPLAVVGDDVVVHDDSAAALRRFSSAGAPRPDVACQTGNVGFADLLGDVVAGPRDVVWIETRPGTPARLLRAPL
jgi:hypothetical protein